MRYTGTFAIFNIRQTTALWVMKIKSIEMNFSDILKLYRVVNANGKLKIRNEVGKMY